MRARDKKKKGTEKKINKARDRGRSDAEARLVLSGSEGILTIVPSKRPLSTAFSTTASCLAFFPASLAARAVVTVASMTASWSSGRVLVPGAGSSYRRRHRLAGCGPFTLAIATLVALLGSFWCLASKVLSQSPQFFNMLLDDFFRSRRWGARQFACGLLHKLS